MIADEEVADGRRPIRLQRFPKRAAILRRARHQRSDDLCSRKTAILARPNRSRHQPVKTLVDRSRENQARSAAFGVSRKSVERQLAPTRHRTSIAQLFIIV